MKSYLSNYLNRSLRIKDVLIFLFSASIIYSLFIIINGKNFFKEDTVVSCDTCGVGITDLVRRVKKELAQLEDSMVKKNENAMFQLKDMGMEISFVVRQSVSGKVGGKYELITVEGSRENSNERVQKLILHWDAEKPKPKTLTTGSGTPLDNNFINSLKKQKP